MDLPRERLSYWVKLAVRWSDLDSMGHVNNATYFTYFEAARIQFFEDGVELDSYRTHARQGPVVVSATCNYRRELLYPATLDIGLHIAALSGRSFTFGYGIYLAASDTLIADGSTVAAWVDFEQGRAMTLPGPLATRLRSFAVLDE